MIMYQDAAYRLEALGLGDDESPLVLQAFCQRCDQRLHERIYRTPADARRLPAEAQEDAARALAHRC